MRSLHCGSEIWRCAPTSAKCAGSHIKTNLSLNETTDFSFLCFISTHSCFIQREICFNLRVTEIKSRFQIPESRFRIQIQIQNLDLWNVRSTHRATVSHAHQAGDSHPQSWAFGRLLFCSVVKKVTFRPIRITCPQSS